MSVGFPIRSDTSQAVQPQMIVGGTKFHIEEVDQMYYICMLICCFVFAYAKSRFSHEVVHICDNYH